MTPLTLQQVFDNAVTVAKTGKKSVRNGECRYRSEDGSKCFIGASIPDDIYSSDFEGEPIVSLIYRKDINGLFYGAQELVLQELQELHDTAGYKEDDHGDAIYDSCEDFNMNEIHEKMKSFAEKYNLSFDWEISP
jgi:hypothetical protein